MYVQILWNSSNGDTITSNDIQIPEIAADVVLTLAIKITTNLWKEFLMETFRLINWHSRSNHVYLHDHTAYFSSPHQALHSDKWPVVLEHQNIPHCLLIIADVPAVCQPLYFIAHMYSECIDRERPPWLGQKWLLGGDGIASGTSHFNRQCADCPCFVPTWNTRRQNRSAYVPRAVWMLH